MGKNNVLVIPSIAVFRIVQSNAEEDIVTATRAATCQSLLALPPRAGTTPFYSGFWKQL
jgi:hypothetical protein